MKPPARLAIFDWGIGGVGVWRALRQRAPRVPVLYLSDSGYTPYGLLSQRELAARVAKVLQLLVERGATAVIVACNAASTVLENVSASVPVSGMIRPVVERFPFVNQGTLGILGGRRTIRSGVFRRALERPGRLIVQRVAQRVSAHIERGDGESAACARDLRRILAPLHHADSILLACTHYPAIRSVIAEQMPGVELIDPAETVVEHALSTFPLPDERAADCALTTGDPSTTRTFARRAWNFDIGRCARCRID